MAGGLDRNARRILLEHGRVTAGDFFTWLKGSRSGTVDPRQISITVTDAARRPVVYTLRRARPLRLTGPTLTAANGADVAIEELELAHDGIEEA